MNLQFLCLSLFLSFVSGRKKTQYDEFCTEIKLQRPYIRYFKGRQDAVNNGRPFLQHPPGLYTDFLNVDMENTYVCVNGLAMLYYRITEEGVPTYHNGELHIFHHHCQLVNYLLPDPLDDYDPAPPLPIDQRRELVGILLMGNKKNYTSPSIQLFTAPFEEAPPGGFLPPLPPIKYNATSLIMIGTDAECRIHKGGGGGRVQQNIRIRSEPPTDPGQVENALTFCRISYAHTDTNVPPAEQAFVNETLKHDALIRGGNCYVPANYTKAIHENVVVKRLEAVTKQGPTETPPDEVWDPDYAYLNATMPKIIPKPTWPDRDPSDFWPEDVCQWSTPQPSDCPEDPKVYRDRLKDFKRLLDEAKNASGNVEQAEKDYFSFMIRPCQSISFTTLTNLKTLYDELKLVWTDAVPKGEAVIKAWEEKVQPAIKLRDDKRWEWEKSGFADTEQTAYEDAERALQTELLEYKKLVNILTPVTSLGDSLNQEFQRVRNLTLRSYDELSRQYHAMIRGGVAHCPVNNETRNLPQVKRKGMGLITIKRDPDVANYLPMDNGTDPTKYSPDAEKNCGSIPTLNETCHKVKPNVTRATQLVRARMGQYPNGSLVGNSPPWKDEDAWRENILKSIASIFSRGCKPMLSLEYGEAVIRIVRGYLTDSITGALKMDNTTGLPIPLPKEDKVFWKPITAGLKNCKDHTRRLRFRRITEGPNRNLHMFLADDREVCLAPRIEQADHEYHLNFVIDGLWQMFLTVYGVCSKYLGGVGKLLPDKFTEAFLTPLESEWASGKDEKVFELIMGEWWRDSGRYWGRQCAAGALLQSDVPPKDRNSLVRKLRVNGGTLQNFLIPTMEENKNEELMDGRQDFDNY